MCTYTPVHALAHVQLSMCRRQVELAISLSIVWVWGNKQVVHHDSMCNYLLSNSAMLELAASIFFIYFLKQKRLLRGISWLDGGQIHTEDLELFPFQSTRLFYLIRWSIIWWYPSTVSYTLPETARSLCPPILDNVAATLDCSLLDEAATKVLALSSMKHSPFISQCCPQPLQISMTFLKGML